MIRHAVKRLCSSRAGQKCPELVTWVDLTKVTSRFHVLKKPLIGKSGEVNIEIWGRLPSRNEEKGTRPSTGLGRPWVALLLWNFLSCLSFQKSLRPRPLPTSSKEGLSLLARIWGNCLTRRPVEGGEPLPDTSPGAGPFHHTPREWHFLALKPQVPKQQPDGGGGGGGEKWRKLQGHSPTLAARLSPTSRGPFSACCPERDRAPVSSSCAEPKWVARPRSRDPGPPRAARRETWEAHCETPGSPWAP